MIVHAILSRRAGAFLSLLRGLSMGLSVISVLPAPPAISLFSIYLVLRISLCFHSTRGKAGSIRMGGMGQARTRGESKKDVTPPRNQIVFFLEVIGEARRKPTSTQLTISTKL